MTQPTTCNPETVRRFLSAQLDPAEQTDFERHLELCHDCRETLQEQAAEPALWDDVRALSSQEIIGMDAWEAGQVDSEDRPQGNDIRLDFLTATDDPQMLGRFGGYEIAAVVGCGGMGIVLKGFDRSLNRFVAIKVLTPHYAASAASRQRFEREGQAAAAVVHDHVIAIHGVAEFGGLPYLVMPYVRGESLQKRLDREGTLSVAEILRIGLQTARGLAAAHDQGLVHRDIKPANLLLPAGVERVLITDFGLARAADDASLTRSGVIAGTPQYMSPEQARGEVVDARSDLFSLGSVMYAMCTGHPPFRAETAYGILRRITDDAVRPIRESNPQIPPWLSAVIDRLLSKSAEDRYVSAEEVAALLEDCLAHVQQPDLVALPATGTSRHAHRGRFMAIALSLAVGIVAVVWLLPKGADAPVMDKTSKNTSDVPSAVATEDAASAGHEEQDSFRWSDDDRLDELERLLSGLREDIGGQ